MYALSVVPEFDFRSNISIEGDALDSEFLAQIGNGRVALGHRGPGKTHLRFSESEFSSPLRPRALAAARGRPWCVPV